MSLYKERRMIGAKQQEENAWNKIINMALGLSGQLKNVKRGEKYHLTSWVREGNVNTGVQTDWEKKDIGDIEIL